MLIKARLILLFFLLRCLPLLVFIPLLSQLCLLVNWGFLCLFWLKCIFPFQVSSSDPPSGWAFRTSSRASRWPTTLMCCQRSSVLAAQYVFREKPHMLWQHSYMLMWSDIKPDRSQESDFVLIIGHIWGEPSCIHHGQEWSSALKHTDQTCTSQCKISVTMDSLQLQLSKNRLEDIVAVMILGRGRNHF